MTYFLPNFDRYDNPRKARAIWHEYSLEIEDSELEVPARDIVDVCQRTIDLDIELDNLISLMHKNPDPVHNQRTKSSNGAWENAVRSYEDH